MKKPVRHGGRRLLLSLADRLTRTKGTKQKSLDNKDDYANDSVAGFYCFLCICDNFVHECQTTHSYFQLTVYRLMAFVCKVCLWLYACLYACMYCMPACSTYKNNLDMLFVSRCSTLISVSKILNN